MTTQDRVDAICKKLEGIPAYQGEIETLRKTVQEVLSLPSDSEEIVRVLRLVEYEGPRKAVEEQLKNSIHGTRWMLTGRYGPGVRITAVTLDQFPEVLEEGRRTITPKHILELQERISVLEQLLTRKGNA